MTAFVQVWSPGDFLETLAFARQYGEPVGVIEAPLVAATRGRWYRGQHRAIRNVR